MRLATCLLIVLLGVSLSRAVPAPKVVERSSTEKDGKPVKSAAAALAEAKGDEVRAKKSISFCVQLKPGSGQPIQTSCNDQQEANAESSLSVSRQTRTSKKEESPQATSQKEDAAKQNAKPESVPNDQEVQVAAKPQERNEPRTFHGKQQIYIFPDPSMMLSNPEYPGQPEYLEHPEGSEMLPVIKVPCSCQQHHLEAHPAGCPCCNKKIALEDHLRNHKHDHRYDEPTLLLECHPKAFLPYHRSSSPDDEADVTDSQKRSKTVINVHSPHVPLAYLKKLQRGGYGAGNPYLYKQFADRYPPRGLAVYTYPRGIPHLFRMSDPASASSFMEAQEAQYSDDYQEDQ